MAWAILCLAALAVLRWQAVMGLHADVSRQRSEAVVDAHRALEQWRAFTQLEAQAGAVSFADVVAGESQRTAASARYTLHRGVSGDPTARLKAVTLAVEWRDRAGNLQDILIASAIDGTLPVHSAALALPPAAAHTFQPRARVPAPPAPRGPAIPDAPNAADPPDPAARPQAVAAGSHPAKSTSHHNGASTHPRPQPP